MAVGLMLIFPITSFCQGAWDLDYTLNDSLTTSVIGKEVRIDFKSPRDTPVGKFLNIRRLLAHNDSVSLIIDDISTRFVEQWHIYPDFGVLRGQYLESIDSLSNIQEIYVDAIDDLTITVTMSVHFAPKFDHPIRVHTTIPRSQIRGLLTRY